MILCFDTETSGLFNKQDKTIDPPRLVRLSAALYDEDREISIADLTIRPDGFRIPADVAAIHGITQDRASLVGVPVKAAMVVLWTMAEAAHELVGFNVQFDIDIINVEFEKAQIGKTFPRPGMGRLDVMKAATPICKIPHKEPRGPDDYKFPKLSDASLSILGQAHRNADGIHDSLSDMRITFQIYRALKEKGAI